MLGVLHALPYRLVVSLPIRESEILDFTKQDWRTLDESGLKTVDGALPSEGSNPFLSATAVQDLRTFLPERGKLPVYQPVNPH